MRSPFPVILHPAMHSLLRATSWLLPLALVACSSTPPAPVEGGRAVPARSAKSPGGGKAYPALPPAGSGRGGYYQDDGPGDNIPPDLRDIPDAEPRVEPFAKGPNKPYSVFGKTYRPLTDTTTPFTQRGMGSWYGKKFQGQKTASGERYDMYKMTAAHPTLPLPSYARVTNLKTGAQVIVRINDRGPFHSNRIIDLSYTAALKLGYLGSGSSELQVDRLLPDEIERMAAARQADSARTAAATPEAVTSPASMRPEVAQLEDGPMTIPAPAAAAALPVATVSADAPASVSSALSGGYYLQFGAYSQEGNAQVARAKLMESLSGLVASLNAVPVKGLYRLYAGPYASRSAAQEAAQLVRERASVTPFVVENK
jgi:rare lipoprotein A